MSKRLQVLVREEELAEIRELAERERLTVAAWVRRALDEAKRRQSNGDPGRKVAAIRAAAEHSFPAGQISSMLVEIDRGIAAGPSLPPPVPAERQRQQSP